MPYPSESEAKPKVWVNAYKFIFMMLNGKVLKTTLKTLTLFYAKISGFEQCYFGRFLTNTGLTQMVNILRI